MRNGVGESAEGRGGRSDDMSGSETARRSAGGWGRSAALGAAALAIAAFVAAGCSEKVPEPTPEPRPAGSKEPEAPEPPDLVKEDLVVGTGPEAKDGDKVNVHYTGRLLKTNFMFDTSVGKAPFPVTIGKGGVIKGW